MQSIFAYLLVATAVASAAPSANQEIGKVQTIRFTQVFTEPSNVGPSEDFFTYAPDLSLQGIDNAIESACQTGLWIYYNDVNYEGDNCWTIGISACYIIFEAQCNAQASSLRYAGNPDELNGDYLNLYAGEYFVGTEFRTNASAITVGEIDQQVSSVIISGNSEWTFFTGPNFSGTSVCSGPNEHYTHDDGTKLSFARIYQMSDMDLPDNSIRSVLKGCVKDAVVEVEALQRSADEVVEIIAGN
ncbi:Gamma-crystallin-related [Trinorchestia longiramus]|nr:Gamma-crystallin-related [Trinorchestia longiramus]